LQNQLEHLPALPLLNGALFAAPSIDPFSSDSDRRSHRFSSDLGDADADDAEAPETSAPPFVAPDMRMHIRREGVGKDDAEMAPLAQRLLGSRGFAAGAPSTPSQEH